MPRYRVEEKPARSEKKSVFALLFPLVSVLYAEGIFAYFSGTGLNVYKILFALAAGCIAVALSRLTPVRVLNFLLQSLWLLFCWGMIAAQFLCFKASGVYFSLFAPVEGLPRFSALLGAAVSSLPFLICMLAPVVLHFTLQRMALLRRRSLLGKLFGADWMELLGMLLLAAILAFISVTLAFYDDTGNTSPRRQMEICFLPEDSAETFGILPQTALDFKYNVLHIAEEEVVHHYIITEDGQQVELTEEELDIWEREG